MITTWKSKYSEMMYRSHDIIYDNTSKYFGQYDNVYDDSSYLTTK